VGTTYARHRLSSQTTCYKTGDKQRNTIQDVTLFAKHAKLREMVQVANDAGRSPRMANEALSVTDSRTPQQAVVQQAAATRH